MPKIEMPNMVMIQDKHTGKRNTPSQNQMPKNYLPMFLEDKYNEAFGPWNDGEAREIVYK